MPVQEKDIENDIDSLGVGKQDLEPVTPHRGPERIEPTVFPTLKPDAEEEDERPTRQQRQPAEQDEEEEQETPEKKSSRENSELREAMAELATTVTQVVKDKPTAPPKPMTQAEMEEYWGVFKPDPKDLRTLFKGISDDATPEALAEHAALFKKVQDGLVKQAFIAARNVFNEELKKRDAQLAEFSSYREQQTARQVRSDFNSRYETLADPKYDRVLKIIAQEINEDKSLNFRNNNEYFDELAKRSAEAIRDYVPDFDLGEPNKKQSTGKLPRLPRSGGGGGTGNTGRTDKGKKPTADSPGGDIDSLV